jgi:chromosome segregation ATPase
LYVGDQPQSISFSPTFLSRSGGFNILGDNNQVEEYRHHTISSTAPEIASNKLRFPGTVNKSHARRRLKYAELPRDIEKALDLVAGHLGNVSQIRKFKDNLEIKLPDVEQQVRIKAGEVLICRQELQKLKQKLADKDSRAEKIQMENAELRENLQDARALAKLQDDEMKSWQSTLRSMLGNREGSSIRS